MALRAQALDLALEAGIAARDVGLDLGHAAVDAAHRRLDVASGDPRPAVEALALPGRPRVLGDQSGDDVGDDRPGQSDGEHRRADPDQGHVPARHVGDAGADAEDSAVGLVEMEFAPLAHLILLRMSLWSS